MKSCITAFKLFCFGFFLLANGSSSFSQSKVIVADFLSKMIENEVYSPGKTYYYQATKWDKNGEVLSSERVGMLIPEALNANLTEEEKSRGLVRFIWTFEWDEETRARLEPLSLAEVELPFGKADTTTMSIDTETLSMHPLRDNQYYQVEASAHPALQAFDEQSQFSVRIIIMNGFGKYKMKEFKTVYTLLDKIESDFVGKNDCKDCIQLKAKTEAKGFSFGSTESKSTDEDLRVGDNSADFLISASRGFVKKHYKFYDGESLLVEMIK